MGQPACLRKASHISPDRQASQDKHFKTSTSKPSSISRQVRRDRQSRRDYWVRWVHWNLQTDYHLHVHQIHQVRTLKPPNRCTTTRILERCGLFSWFPLKYLLLCFSRLQSLRSFILAAWGLKDSVWKVGYLSSMRNVTPWAFQIHSSWVFDADVAF